MTRRPPLDAQDVWLFSGLTLLSAGTWLDYGLGTALISVGVVVIGLAVWALARRAV